MAWHSDEYFKNEDNLKKNVYNDIFLCSLTDLVDTMLSSTSFAFDLVDESIVIKHISTLRTKNSYGHDRISMKLLKFLLPAVIKPLTLVINQSLATGIFPEKLKIV